MFYKCLSLWKIITNYRELQKLWNQLRWFQNSETLATILSFSAVALEPSSYCPCIHNVKFVAAARHCAMWVWDAGTPHLVIGVLRTGILPMIASLTFLTPLPPLCAASHIARFRSKLLRVVKRVPCRVPKTRMSPVMDDRVVSRGLCCTNGYTEPPPSYLSMDVASRVHAS
jgi:hypothetical protein